VAFSLFGKKDDPPSKKPEPKKTEARPAATGKPAPSAAVTPKPEPLAGAPGDDDDLSLDFTSFVPLPLDEAPEPEPAPVVPVQAAAKPSLASAPPAPAAPAKAPPPKPAAPASAKPAPAAPKSAAPAAARPAPMPVPPAQVKRKPPPPDSVMSIEVTSASDGLAVVEEAAILFANAQEKAALSVLKKAAGDKDTGKTARQVWLMLFDLYEHLGMRAEHDALSLEFAAKFERSPPTWTERAEIAASMPAMGGGAVGFGSALDAGAAVRIEQVNQIAAVVQSLSFDLSKLAAIDATGCGLLLQCLQKLRRAGKSVAFSGEASLLGLLGANAQSGDKTVDQAFWLLLLEVYQTLGRQDAYEEAALNFAITYELSPPAWEAPPPASRQAAAAPRTPQAEQMLRLSGEITGADEVTLKTILDYAADSNLVLIDFSAVSRVDFVSAGQLLNTFSKLHQAGKSVKIRGANELILALFGVMGVQAVTGIEQKR
jgi:anti-anti-sigma regulatory factor